jgi:hypothetical protein
MGLGMVLWLVVRGRWSTVVDGGEEERGRSVYVCTFLIKVTNMGLCVSVNISFICKTFLVIS